MKHDKSRSYAEGYAEGYAAGREASHSEVLLRELVRKKWASSAPIPTDSKHPARRWLAARHLWRPDLQLPPSVRWLQAEGPPSVGGLLAAFAPPGQLEPSGVQLVSVDVDGRPAPDIDGPDGLAMRSIGAMRGAVCVLGMPAADRGVNVAEGLDDALALAARLALARRQRGRQGWFLRCRPCPLAAKPERGRCVAHTGRGGRAICVPGRCGRRVQRRRPGARRPANMGSAPPGVGDLGPSPSPS